MTREQLISRKHEVQQQLFQAQRRLEQARAQMDSAVASDAHGVDPSAGWFAEIWRWIQMGLIGPRDQQAKIAGLETKVASLMAEEYRLRCLIDRS